MRRYTLDVGSKEFVVDVQEVDIDNFEVVVGDQTYLVALAADEEAYIAPADATKLAAAKPVAAPVARKERSAAPAPSAAASAAPRKAPAGGGANMMSAPMPGVIIEVCVKPGDTVERGQKVAVLDAMKMHNLIGATRAGTIAEVYVTEGQSVNHGDAIVKFQEG